MIRLLVAILVLGITAVTNSAAQADPRAETWEPVAAPAGFDTPGAEWIKVHGPNGRAFITAVLRPSGTGPFPVVVVLHGGSGLGPQYVDLAADLARAGFIAIAGCWQALSSPPAPMPHPVCSEATPQVDWERDPAANSGKELIAVARTLLGARADRVGLFGLSRGGHAGLWAASTGAGVQAVVLDAPAHVPIIPNPPPKPLDVIADLDAPLLIMHGTDDAIVPVDQSKEYEAAARALGKPVTAVYFEGIGHLTSARVSMATEPPTSQAEARRLAIDFLSEHLLDTSVDLSL
jgi:dienelactone hydrolase